MGKDMNGPFMKWGTHTANKCTKRCSTSLAPERCKLKPRRQSPALLRGKRRAVPCVGMHVEKPELLWLLVRVEIGITNLEKSLYFFLSLDVGILYVVAILLLGTYPETRAFAPRSLLVCLGSTTGSSSRQQSSPMLTDGEGRVSPDAPTRRHTLLP